MEQTSQQYVRSRYPDAIIKSGVEYIVIVPLFKGQRISDFCKTPGEAWDSAKRRFTHPHNNGWNLELYKAK